MKPRSVIRPIVLPQLSAAAAVQLVQLLRDILAIVEDQYVPQIQRHRLRGDARPPLRAHPPPHDEDPF